jgi:hypothetical protein
MLILVISQVLSCSWLNISSVLLWWFRCGFWSVWADYVLTDYGYVNGWKSNLMWILGGWWFLGYGRVGSVRWDVSAMDWVFCLMVFGAFRLWFRIGVTAKLHFGLAMRFGYGLIGRWAVETWGWFGLFYGLIILLFWISISWCFSGLCWWLEKMSCVRSWIYGFQGFMTEWRDDLFGCSVS